MSEDPLLKPVPLLSLKDTAFVPGAARAEEAARIQAARRQRIARIRAAVDAHLPPPPLPPGALASSPRGAPEDPNILAVTNALSRLHPSSSSPPPPSSPPQESSSLMRREGRRRRRRKDEDFDSDPDSEDDELVADPASPARAMHAVLARAHMHAIRVSRGLRSPRLRPSPAFAYRGPHREIQRVPDGPDTLSFPSLDAVRAASPSPLPWHDDHQVRDQVSRAREGVDPAWKLAQHKKIMARVAAKAESAPMEAKRREGGTRPSPAFLAKGRPDTTHSSILDGDDDVAQAPHPEQTGGARRWPPPRIIGGIDMARVVPRERDPFSLYFRKGQQPFAERSYDVNLDAVRTRALRGAVVDMDKVLPRSDLKFAPSSSAPDVRYRPRDLDGFGKPKASLSFAKQVGRDGKAIDHATSPQMERAARIRRVSKWKAQLRSIRHVTAEKKTTPRSKSLSPSRSRSPSRHRPSPISQISPIFREKREALLGSPSDRRLRSHIFLTE